MLNMYDDMVKLRSLIKERSRLAYRDATKDISKDTYLYVVKTREFNVYQLKLDSYSLEELQGQAKYYNSIYHYPAFEGYEELMEILAQGTLEESFLHRLRERHRRECDSLQYINSQVCVIPTSATSYDADHYLITLSDPYNTINAIINKKLFKRTLLGEACFAEIGITSYPQKPHTINKLVPLSTLNEKRNEMLKKKHTIVSAKTQKQRNSAP